LPVESTHGIGLISKVISVVGPLGLLIVPANPALNSVTKFSIEDFVPCETNSVFKSLSYF
jgi:hypothetical protein